MNEDETIQMYEKTVDFWQLECNIQIRRYQLAKTEEDRKKAEEKLEHIRARLNREAVSLMKLMRNGTQ